MEKTKCSIRRDRRTDKTKLRAPCRNFENVSKKKKKKFSIISRDFRRFPCSSWNLHFKRKIYFFIRLYVQEMETLKKNTATKFDSKQIPGFNYLFELFRDHLYFHWPKLSPISRVMHRYSTRELINWFNVTEHFIKIDSSVN